MDLKEKLKQERGGSEVFRRAAVVSAGQVPFCMQTPAWPCSQCWGEALSPPAAAVTQIWGKMLQQHLQANPESQSSTQLDYLH